ncbi:hypothetical protein [Gemmatimonas sp.]|uniref:hypothetical protein n=1 Tax=Gemmatimonas sp. TaxID=1962908 RepID=UPI0025BC4CDE|nr:hypothetical protein [Gemmatimonas sp.]MCA2991878.1 hypothetical protein [Gemmatimonas sp.]
MPMLPFLPWATISEPLRFGDFHLMPLGVAINEGAVPATMVDPVMAVLAAYGKTRPVDAASVPLMHRHDMAALADLTDEQVTDYFGFRLRLTFAAIASRRFFDHRYLNSDNLQLVIQGFEPDRAGGAIVQSRRRDGAVNNIIPKGHLNIRRPNHISGGCELPRDLDVPLLEALEKVRDSEADLVERLDDVVRLFVGANTDSPDISEHSELVDLVSAFGRLVGEWKEPETVRAFVKLLPSPDADMLSNKPGTRAGKARLIDATANKSVRAVWLKDAFLLRHSYGHGRVTAPSHTPIWSQREHLLLGSVALPLVVAHFTQVDHAFRSKAITGFGSWRSAVSADVDHRR